MFHPVLLSKTIANEKDMLKVGYGAMILESVLAVLALCVAGAAAKNGIPAEVLLSKSFQEVLQVSLKRWDFRFISQQYL